MGTDFVFFSSIHTSPPPPLQKKNSDKVLCDCGGLKKMQIEGVICVLGKRREQKHTPNLIISTTSHLDATEVVSNK
jgi:hypothetical protein